MKFLRLNQRLINLSKIIYTEDTDVFSTDEDGKVEEDRGIEIVFSSGARLMLVGMERSDFIDALEAQNAVIEA